MYSACSAFNIATGTDSFHTRLARTNIEALKDAEPDQLEEAKLAMRSLKAAARADIALSAAYPPATKASTVDPMTALRQS
jgi:hypothetical protein